MPVDAYLHLYERDLGFTHYEYGAAEEAFMQGNEEFVKENWKGALDHFSTAADLDPSKSEYLLHKAAAMCKLGTYSQAVAVCDEVLSKEPSNAKAYLRKGMALVSSGDLTQAASALQAGQAVDPSNKTFGTWLKKCGLTGSDVASAAPGAAVTAATVSSVSNVGKHDAELQGLLASHGNQGYALLETVVEFLSRKSNVIGLSSAPEMLGALAVKYSPTATPKPTSNTSSIPTPQPATHAQPLPPAASSTAASGGKFVQVRNMPILVSPSAKKAWEKAVADRAIALQDPKVIDPNFVASGTQCKNNGCTLVYENDSSLQKTCMHHPGGPVFHEGYKYWSCCKKKRTTEFSEFMSFPGCTKGACVFKEDPTKRKKALCRYDFFQQGGTVTLSIYAKKVDPEQCQVELSATRLSLSILFDFVNSFNLDVDLTGRVDPEACKVEILAPKVEITLKKADGTNWTDLGTLLCSAVEDA